MGGYANLSVAEQLRVNAYILNDLFRNKNIDPSKPNVGYTDAFIRYVRETQHSKGNGAKIEDAFDAVLNELRDTYAVSVDSLPKLASPDYKTDLSTTISTLRVLRSAMQMDGAGPNKIRQYIEENAYNDPNTALRIGAESSRVTHGALNYMYNTANALQASHLEADYGYDITNVANRIQTSLGDHREAQLLATAIKELNKKPEATFSNPFGSGDRTPEAMAAVTKALSDAGVNYNTNDVRTIVTAAKTIKTTFAHINFII